MILSYWKMKETTKMKYTDIQTRKDLLQFIGGKEQLFRYPQHGRVLKIAQHKSNIGSTYTFAVISGKEYDSCASRIYKLVYVDNNKLVLTLFVSFSREKLLRRLQNRQLLFRTLSFETEVTTV